MKKQQLVLNVPPALKEWLRDQAAKTDRSLNYIAEGILQKALDAHSKEPNP
ncbi:hypothetical protein [Xanthomonas arboricola]|uniref:CopG-like ribbon-helix-helix domain-containing protein n=1 Tax=Xanthomonas arboricola TaxID=56448 RepID=A0AAU9IIC4_9XANT|nr:hypothetical protein [Xanthomonas arboricola]CAE6837745.1 hypothetical protein XA1314C_37440 [Xanthomonas arboricola]CAE6837773.1 hypothetical protein XA1314C_37440 [Xanthomonas arboricola]